MKIFNYDGTFDWVSWKFKINVISVGETEAKRVQEDINEQNTPLNSRTLLELSRSYRYPHTYSFLFFLLIKVLSKIDFVYLSTFPTQRER